MVSDEGDHMPGPADGWHETLSSERRGRPSERSFGFSFAGIFSVFGSWLLWQGDPLGGTCLFGLAAGFLIATLARPGLLAPLNSLWSRIGMVLQALVSPLVMAVLFYGVITPIGLLLRLIGHDPLRRRMDPKLQSYWIVRRPTVPQTRMKDQF
jgi:hypothetical protein